MKIIVKREPHFELTLARHGMTWTRDEDWLLRSLAERRDPAERIASVLGRSVNAVVARWEIIGRLPDGLYPLAYRDNGEFDSSTRRPIREQFALPETFVRQRLPSKSFANKWPNTCAVCLGRMPRGELVHFVAADKIAHAECY